MAGTAPWQRIRRSRSRTREPARWNTLGSSSAGQDDCPLDCRDGVLSEVGSAGRCKAAANRRRGERVNPAPEVSAHRPRERAADISKGKQSDQTHAPPALEVPPNGFKHRSDRTVGILDAAQRRSDVNTCPSNHASIFASTAAAISVLPPGK
jgi:hypothetical protein